MKKSLLSLIAISLCVAILLPLVSACDKNHNKGIPGEESGFTLSDETYKPTYNNADIPEGLKDVVINATELNGNTVKCSTGFTLLTSGNVSESELSDAITITPSVPVSYTKTANGYDITPSRDLESGTVYKLTIGDPENPYNSFAFQTESVFKITSFYPANQRTSVSVDTGIEISFSEAVSKNNDLDQYISITPVTKGSFEFYPDGKTIVFIPKESLKEYCCYTVTVKQGIKSENGAILESGGTTSFTTMNSQSNLDTVYFCAYLNKSMQVVSPGSDISLSVDYYGYSIVSTITNRDISLNKAQIELYRYSDSKEALTAITQGINKIIKGDVQPFSTNGLKKVMDEEISVTNNDYGQKSIVIPGTEAGFYIATITLKATVGITACSSTVQAFIQVSDYREYHETSGDKAMIWVNSINGKPVSNSEISIYSADSKTVFDGKTEESSFAESKAVTDSNGIASFKIDNSDMFIFDIGGKLIATSYNNDSNNKNYICRNYTDREVYFTDDVVNFSGILMPVNGAELPNRIYLETSLSLSKQRIEVNKNGYFKGSIVLEGCGSRHLSFRLSDADGNVVYSDYIAVTNEDKPIYKASLKFDELYYEFGDIVTATLKASFFDGTPAPGLEFSFLGNEFLEYSTDKTDENGEIKINFKTSSIYDLYSTDPTRLYLTAELIGMETSSLSAYADVVYFQSQNAFGINREETGIKLTLNKYNPSVITSEADLSYTVFPENCIGEATEGNATVILVKYHSEKKSTGTYYDPITKKNKTRYSYDVIEQEVSRKTVIISSDGFVLDYIEPEEGYWYTYSIIYDDNENGEIEYQIYTTKNKQYEYRYYNSGIWLKSPDRDAVFSVGDIFDYSVYDGDELLSNDTPILLSVYANKSGNQTECRLVSSQFTVTFTEEYMFGASGVAVVFCGDSYQTLYMTLPKYNTEDSELNIKIDTDKNKYKPGETATVTITVTDKDGKPLSGMITAGVVDEACFAICNQELNPLSEWFSNFNSYVYRNMSLNPFVYTKIKTGLKTIEYYHKIWFWQNTLSYSREADYTDGDIINDAPKADDHDSESKSIATKVRENFADNPFFENIKIGENGTAILTFTVPDNITEWRISCIATSGTEAGKPESVVTGSATSNIIATLPFFINLAISDNYVVGDDISLSARIAGTVVNSLVNVVKYTAELTDYSGKIISFKETEAKPGEYAHFDFNNTEAGTYSVTVKAACDDYSDGIKKTFTITNDGITVPIRKTININDIGKITPQVYPVRVSFFNAAYSEFLSAADIILRRNYDRSDSLAARYAVLTVFEKLFGESSSNELDTIAEKLSGYANSYGLIPLLENSEEDIILSAKIAAIVPSCLSDAAKYALVSSFTDKLNKNIYDTDAEMAACFMGLAALGNPVLNELKSIVKYKLSDEAYIYISTAFALCGDYSSAKQVYDIVKSHIVYDTESYYNAGTTEESILMTAETLIAASIIDKENAYSFVRYLKSHTATTDLTALETAAYIRYFYPIEAKEETLTYKTGEINETITLKPGEIFTLTLGKSDIENLTVTGDDNLVARVYYEGNYNEATNGITKADNISVTKTIKPYRAESGLYYVTITVSGTTDKDYIWFTVSDRIPTGARYYPQYYWHDSSATNGYIGLYNDGNQMMQGYAGIYSPYNSDELLKGKQSYNFSMSTSYIIRGAVAGEFVLSPVVMINTDDGIFAISESGKINISQDGTIRNK